MRYRKIHCLIWNDDKFPFLPDDTKLVFLHLLTTPFGTPFGLYKASIGALADEMRWDRERYEYAIRDAINHGLVEYDEKAYLVYIPNFLKYNLPTSVNQVKSWKNIFDELPNSPLKTKFLRQLKAIADGIRDGIGDAIRDAFALASLIQEQEQEQDIYNTNCLRSLSGTIENRPGPAAEPAEDSTKNNPDLRCEDNGKDNESPEEVRDLADADPDNEDPVFIELPVRRTRKTDKATTHRVTEKKVREYEELFPAVDVRQELRNMRAWLVANPDRRKTARGVNQFITRWLIKAQDSGKVRPREPPDSEPEPIPAYYTEYQE